MAEAIVTVEQGQLQGKIETNHDGQPFYSFQGVPYAKAPLGELRFKDPKPAEPWTGIRNATLPGEFCFCSQFCLEKTCQSMKMCGSEDCLFLNIFTPTLKNNSPKPVMLFIHGGGYITGSSCRTQYGPELLMTEDIVLVTINYRLGPLGFLSLDDPSVGSIANAGLKDMIEALRWVQRNISKFGGDPDNVTIFGESAGASSVHYLVLSPITKGLFHKAILQSGCVLNCWSEGTKNNALIVAAALDCKETDKQKIFEFLQNVPVEKLIETQAKLGDHFDVSEIRYFGPVVDQFVVPDEPVQIIKSGNYNHVPMMIGYTSMETLSMDFFKIIMQSMDIRMSNPKCLVPYFLGCNKNSEQHSNLTNKIIKFYFKSNEYDVKNVEACHRLGTDNYFFREINSTVKGHARNSTKPIYYYRMSVESKLNVIKGLLKVKIAGAAHADDIGYLFNSVLAPPIEPNSFEDLAFRRFTKMWANFARYGNPTPPNQADSVIKVQWKPVEKNNLYYLDIGKELVLGTNPDHERMKFWDEIYQPIAG